MTRSRRLIVLGSTGSIGTSTLEVVEHLTRSGATHFEVVGLAAGSNAQRLCEQAERFNVPAIALADGADAGRPGRLNEHPRRFVGPDAARQLIDDVARPGDLVVAAMVGAAGLPATLLAIERGCDIALANKETLVAAGALVMDAASRAGVSILPIDSEHSALLQCLPTDGSIETVRRVVITASGGPFRTWSAEAIRNATVEQAMAHPTWNMGRKVTIDSATMVNKALEVIEAHWLFGLQPEQIEVIVHPQSIVHSFVEYVDGSVIAQLGAPDMRTPIQHALTWPTRDAGCSQRLDFTAMHGLDFEQPDVERFPALPAAWAIIRHGGTSGATFNAANEAAVEGFLSGALRFGGISDVIAETLERVASQPVTTLDDVLAADQRARRAAAELIERRRIDRAGSSDSSGPSSLADTSRTSAAPSSH